jgi:hypothetical protein
MARRTRRHLPAIFSRYIVLSEYGMLKRDAEDHVAIGPDLRIGDADREAAAARLREHYALGRGARRRGRVLAAAAATRWR